MTNTPRLQFVHNRLHRLSKTGNAPIELRITYNRKQKYIGTGIFITPKQWKEGHIVNHKEEVLLNQRLDSLMIKVRKLLMIDEVINLSTITQELKKDDTGSLYSFIEKRASIRMYNKSNDTKDRYNRFIRLFKSYGKISSFKDINDENILAYDKYLDSKGMKPYSKWNNYHRFLNSFIIDAINERLLKRNPYRWINIDKDKDTNGYKRCLTPEEFQKIKRVKLSTKCLQQVRDVFVFQTYTCLSYADLKNFDINAIYIINGMRVYLGKRDKTGKDFTIPLIKPALEILEKYNNKLPVISNVKYNQYLKVVAQAAKIDKPVSTHWARHTGATILLNSGVPMQIISKICGHSSTKITEQIYAKLLDETVVDAIKKIL